MKEPQPIPGVARRGDRLCDSVCPESGLHCGLVHNHTGDHLCNGLGWSQYHTAPLPPPDDPVHHPRHYTNHPSGIECIEVTRHMNFNRGNAVKYIWRAGEKGPAVEDLRKAIWYLQDEVKRLEKE